MIPSRSLLCALVALVPLTTAYRIPTKLGNGVWEIAFVPETYGDEVMIAQYNMDPYINITATEQDFALPMPITGKECGPNDYKKISLDQTDMQAAQLRLINWCEQYNPRKASIVLSIQNNATWYVCNYDRAFQLHSLQQHCSRDELVAAAGIMDKKCGVRKTAILLMKGWLKHYGRGLKPDYICQGVEKNWYNWPTN